jgi:hypothetical protein
MATHWHCLATCLTRPAPAPPLTTPPRFVTYKWPSWLHKQTEKQRIIWAYKILFLDVLFPLGLKKVRACWPSNPCTHSVTRPPVHSCPGACCKALIVVAGVGPRSFFYIAPPPSHTHTHTPPSPPPGHLLRQRPGGAGRPAGAVAHGPAGGWRLGGGGAAAGAAGGRGVACGRGKRPRALPAWCAGGAACQWSWPQACKTPAPILPTPPRFPPPPGRPLWLHALLRQQPGHGGLPLLEDGERGPPPGIDAPLQLPCGPSCLLQHALATHPRPCPTHLPRASQGFWKDHLQGRPYHISALYVVDLERFRWGWRLGGCACVRARRGQGCRASTTVVVGLLRRGRVAGPPPPPPRAGRWLRGTACV